MPQEGGLPDSTARSLARRLEQIEDRWAELETYKAMALEAKAAAAEARAASAAVREASDRAIEEANDVWSWVAFGGPGKKRPDYMPVILERLGKYSRLVTESAKQDQESENRWKFLSNVLQALIAVAATAIADHVGKGPSSWW